MASMILFVSCSSDKTAEDYYKDAQKYSQERKIPEAVNAYETLLMEFPDDTLAPVATAELAAIYQNKMVKNLSEKESIQKAVELYKSIYQKYPESDEAPMGLFMAGFLQANELKDFNAATETYNFFLEKFPNHELATSAKEELDNMGLSPEEILKKNLAEKDSD